MEGKLLLDLLQVDLSDGLLTIEDLGDLFEGGAVGLDVDEVDEDELDKVPELFDIDSLANDPEWRSVMCDRLTV